MPSPATDAMRRPACSEPVKLTMSTSGCATMASPTTRPEPDDDVEHAFRQADLVRGLGEHERAERRHFRRLQHDRAAGGERRRDLADDLMQRVIPRRHAADDADRFLDDERVAELFFELRLANELGVHPDHHDRELGLDLGGKPDRGADFVRDRFRDLRHARLHRGGELLEPLRALFDAEPAPRFESAPRRLDRAIDIFGGAARHARDSCSVADEITAIVSVPVDVCHAPS